MPAAPEFRDGPGEIRAPEILRHIDAHRLCTASGDIDAAGEVRIVLHGIQEDADDDAEARQIQVVGKDEIDGDRGAVSDDHFLEISPQHQLQSSADIERAASASCRQLRRQIVPSADRPLDDLREERHEQRHLERITLRLGLFPVHIDHIGQRLESIKRNSNWKRHLKKSGSCSIC